MRTPSFSTTSSGQGFDTSSSTRALASAGLPLPASTIRFRPGRLRSFCADTGKDTLLASGFSESNGYAGRSEAAEGDNFRSRSSPPLEEPASFGASSSSEEEDEEEESIIEIVTRRLARGILAVDGGTSTADLDVEFGFGRRGCSGSGSPVDVADLHIQQGA